MARRLRLDQMMLDGSIEGSRMSVASLTTDEILRWVREPVAGGPSEVDLFTVPMRPSDGYVSLVS